MSRAGASLPGVSLVGVGAVFDWVPGNMSQGPEWMQRSGLEWLYRLSREPRRFLESIPPEQCGLPRSGRRSDRQTPMGWDDIGDFGRSIRFATRRHHHRGDTLRPERSGGLWSSSCTRSEKAKITRAAVMNWLV